MKHTSHTRAVRFLSGMLYFFSIFIFINAFNFQHNPPGGWYKQLLPDIGGAIVVDLTFTDSLNGVLVTGTNSLGRSYLLRTTDGGDNWVIVLVDTGRSFRQVEFTSDSIGYATLLAAFERSSVLLRTADKGMTWNQTNVPTSFFQFDCITTVSEDEVWTVCTSIFSGAVWRSLDGGQNWQRMLEPLVTNNPDRIYMVNSEIGFVSDGNDIHSYLKKTTNGGVTWNVVPGGKGWREIYFKDTLTGWKSIQYGLEKTTNGGISWTTLLQPQPGNPDVSISSFSVLNDNTIWGVDSDANILFSNGQYRGVILKTTNAGLNWGYQLPDTSFRMPFFVFCDFVNLNVGWAYNSVHTVTAGDTITYPLTSVSEEAVYESSDYQLFQNYPNPFNSSTTIRFLLSRTSLAEINVYDIAGRQVSTIVKDRFQAGMHSFSFDAGGLPSGCYIYTLKINGALRSSKRLIFLK